MLISPYTEFNEDGFLQHSMELRRLRLLIEGSSNDLNNNSSASDQAANTGVATLTSADVQALIDASHSLGTQYYSYANGASNGPYNSGSPVLFGTTSTLDPYGAYGRDTGLWTAPFTGNVCAVVEIAANFSVAGDTNGFGLLDLRRRYGLAGPQVSVASAYCLAPNPTAGLLTVPFFGYSAAFISVNAGDQLWAELDLTGASFVSVQPATHLRISYLG